MAWGFTGRPRAGVDCPAAHDDDVLDPTGDVEVPLGVEEAEVAGTEPAVRRQHLAREVGAVVVALHQAGALDQDLALAAGWEVGVAVPDRDRDARAGPPHGEVAPRRVEPDRLPSPPARPPPRG